MIVRSLARALSRANTTIQFCQKEEKRDFRTVCRKQIKYSFVIMNINLTIDLSSLSYTYMIHASLCTRFFVNLLHLRHMTFDIPFDSPFFLSFFFHHYVVDFLAGLALSTSDSPLTIHVCVYYVRGESRHACTKSV